MRHTCVNTNFYLMKGSPHSGSALRAGGSVESQRSGFERKR
jgi:hypothetical protein